MTSAASDLDLEVAAARSWDDECAVADDLDAYPGGAGGAMSGPAGDALADSDPAASLELRHGYTLDSLNRLAHFAARRKRWHGGAELPVRYEVAWAAMTEYLYAAAEPPSVGELIEAGWHAIAAHIDAERQFHGRARDRPGPITSFERYWRAVAAPDDSPEAKVTDRIA